MFGTFLIKIVEKILLVQVIKIQAFIILQIDMIRLAQLYLYNTPKRITQRRLQEIARVYNNIGAHRHSQIFRSAELAAARATVVQKFYDTDSVCVHPLSGKHTEVFGELFYQKSRTVFAICFTLVKICEYYTEVLTITTVRCLKK